MLNHVALLVPSVDRAARVLKSRGLEVGPAEVWEGEGTREIYVGPAGCEGRLLLMEPAMPGSYHNALTKRGPGLHHLAIDVLDMEKFIGGLAGSGWYLHPKSLQTIRTGATAWLARPGTAALIEVHAREKIELSSPFVTQAEMPLTAREAGMMRAVGLNQVMPSQDGGRRLMIAGSAHLFEEFF